jgi:acyl carrier protein
MDLWVVRHPQRPGALVAHVGKDIVPLELIRIATASLHRYEVPTHICVLASTKGLSAKQLADINPKPKDAVASILSGSNSAGGTGAGGGDPLIPQVQDIFLELLGLDYIPAPDADFFQIGGSSMTASQLASKVRKSFGVPCAGAEVFHHSTSVALVELIRSRMDDNCKKDDTPEASSLNRRFHLASFETTRMRPQNNVFSALFQLLPVFFVFPVWQISRYLLFFATLLNHWRLFPGTTDRSFLTFLMAYVVFQILWVTFAPLVSFHGTHRTHQE